ncbi:MAG: beta-ketoacyl-[acyl-carrier-protein] synthase family protein [Phycisphaerales bacterium]|nr:beta-ketoacyl-[acyl-carrier-protein] synthase family protein [Phycisphaerales bacterium]
MRRVVITGIGVVSPLGIGTAAFWNNLLAGQVALQRIDLFDPSGFSCQIGGQVPAYKINEHVPKSYRKATNRMARDIELAVIAADDAFKNANLQSNAYSQTPAFDGKRFGCNIGAGLISAELNELTATLAVARNGDELDLKKWGTDGMGQLTPLWLLKYLPNMLACHVTIIHQLKGPSNTITCSDASSHLAIGEAFRTIQRGDADLAICGGAESRLNPMGLMRYHLLKRLTTTHNETPAQALRPFDADASGGAIGEGGGLFILEEYEHAMARKAPIHAELIGFAATQDAYSVTEPDPSGKNYARAIQKALSDAKLSAADIGCIVPHGLGVPEFDQAELNGLRLALGNHLEKVPFAPIKAQTGNLIAGSGADAAAAALTVSTGKVPPAVNTQQVIDGQRLNVASQSRALDVPVAISSVYSLGGQNAALVFKRV